METFDLIRLREIWKKAAIRKAPPKRNRSLPLRQMQAGHSDARLPATPIQDLALALLLHSSAAEVDMKRLTTLLILIPILTFGTALAQPQQGRGAGYGYAAFGAATDGGNNEAFWAFGGGGEYVASSGLGFRLDLGVLRDSGFEGGLGIFSPGLMFEFKPERKTAPFVAGGYTLFFSSETDHGFHFGGGVRHWFSDGFGIRFEVRDDVLAEHAIHFVLGRVSFLFR